MAKSRRAPAAPAPKPAAAARPARPQPALPPRNPPPSVKESRLKVRATMTGYYDHARRHEGDVFTIDGKRYAPGHKKAGHIIAFSERWMEMVDPTTKNVLTTAQGAIDKAHDAILGGQSSKPTGDEDPLGAGTAD